MGLALSIFHHPQTRLKHVDRNHPGKTRLPVFGLPEYELILLAPAGVCMTAVKQLKFSVSHMFEYYSKNIPQVLRCITTAALVELPVGPTCPRPLAIRWHQRQPGITDGSPMVLLQLPPVKHGKRMKDQRYCRPLAQTLRDG